MKAFSGLSGVAALLCCARRGPARPTRRQSGCPSAGGLWHHEQERPSAIRREAARIDVSTVPDLVRLAGAGERP
jgi:hypothetical protein